MRRPRRSARRRSPDFPREIELFTDEERVLVHAPRAARPLATKFFALCAERIDGVARDGFLDYRSGGDTFRVGRGSFFQVNRFLTDELARRAVGDASGGLALDLYCGAGLTTLPLARRFKRTVGVDAHQPATRSLRCNLDRAGLDARVVNLDAGRFPRGFRRNSRSGRCRPAPRGTGRGRNPATEPPAPQADASGFLRPRRPWGRDLRRCSPAATPSNR